MQIEYDLKRQNMNELEQRINNLNGYSQNTEYIELSLVSSQLNLADPEHRRLIELAKSKGIDIDVMSTGNGDVELHEKS